MLFENPNAAAKLFPAFNIPPPVRIRENKNQPQTTPETIPGIDSSQCWRGQFIAKSGGGGGVEVSLLEQAAAAAAAGLPVLGGGAAELHAHVLGAHAAQAAAAAHAAAAAAHHHHQQQQQAQQQQQQLSSGNHAGSSGRSTPQGGGGAAPPAPGSSPSATSPGGGGGAGGGAGSASPSKLFVGGLSWQTSSEKLREYFNMFGHVTDVLIMKDPVTQRSRGFGFITFQEASSVEAVLKVPSHTLDGKRIDPKHATPKSRPNKTKKIFVGGVGQDTTAEEVRAYFAQFGCVEEAVMLMDQQTKRHRGFGFVTFESEEAVDRVCDIHFHTIKNKKVECKRAQPKEAAAAPALASLAGKRLVLPTTLRAPPAVPRLVYPTAAYRYAPYALPASVPPPACAPPPPQAAVPPFGASYQLAGVDMSSFQGIDWGAMYGVGMYL